MSAAFLSLLGDSASSSSVPLASGARVPPASTVNVPPTLEVSKPPASEVSALPASTASVPPASEVNMLLSSTASIPPASEASVPPVRICFTTVDDILLLHEVAGHKQSCARASLGRKLLTALEHFVLA